jgi:transcriptional repressor NrdR
MPLVVKKDGRRENFVREKIADGILKACQKRTLTVVDIENMVRAVEVKMQGVGLKEISSQEIGSMVMDVLRTTDKVAYIRFASVYREFKDVEEFFNELRDTSTNVNPPNLL